MPDFRLVAPFEPTGDQPQAIERLADGLARGVRGQVLLGVTGSGKTYTAAQLIQQHQKPTLVLAHNKTLAAQLYAEFREFFPDNAVEYFVSYFDYYQPEAYLPRSDTYIEKDSLAQRGDRPAPARGDPRAVRASRRDHRRVGVVHLRPRRPGRLRRDDPAPADRRPVPAGRRAPAPRRPPVPAQRHGPDPRAVPGARRHAGDRAGLVRGDRPGRVLRRRGRADHRDRPAHGRAPRRAQGAQHLPGDPLRDAARQAPARHRDHRGGDGGARRPDGGGGTGARGGAAPPADDLRPRDAARARLLQRRRELLAPPEPARARIAAVDAARLLPAGLAADRRRVAHHDPAGRRHVQERPDAQGDPGRLRLPPPVGARQPAAHVRGVRGDREPGRVRVGHAGTVRAREERAGGRAAGPPDRDRRPPDRGSPDRRADRRPARGDPRPRRPRRAGAGHDADQEDGRGPGRLPQGAGRQGPVPPQRGRHARAGGDPARPAPRRVRRPRRDQPAARGPGPARRSRWSRSSTPTRRASCAAPGR